MDVRVRLETDSLHHRCSGTDREWILLHVPAVWSEHLFAAVHWSMLSVELHHHDSADRQSDADRSSWGFSRVYEHLGNVDCFSAGGIFRPTRYPNRADGMYGCQDRGSGRWLVQSDR